MRPLTIQETIKLENQQCRCRDWSRVMVADDFSADEIHSARFEGDIRIGSGVVMDHVGIIRTANGATFGEDNLISVKNEAGPGNVTIFSRLSSQLAGYMLLTERDEVITHALRQMIHRYVEENRPPCTTIGNNVTITDCRELTNVNIGDGCELCGASRLIDCTLMPTPEASIYIGDNVIMENVVAQAGAVIVDAAKLYDTFVGEACHIGRGFTSENSIFFANSHMDNGEACAALCGPFSVSHHKATLLIGGEYSFYNAGSATNFSNHAYKMGPIHHGTLARGSKTASGAHILWPAHIGAFSMVMGKIQTHPDTSKLPFSYVIGEGQKTIVVPGRNLLTVGTYRDITKWPKRDKRPQKNRISLITQDWLSPYVIEFVREGLDYLKQLQEEQGTKVEEYECKGFVIRNSSLLRGIEHYRQALRMYQGAPGPAQWSDLLGMLTPQDALDQITEDVASGDIADLMTLEARFKDIFYSYEQWKGFTSNVSIAEQAHEQWLTQVRRDAEREFSLGDVSKDILTDFLNSLE